MTINTVGRAAVAACLGLALSGPVVAAAQRSAPDADAVESTIEQRWEQDAQLKACKGCDIDVSFENGVAVLTGEVPTTALRTRAARLARVSSVSRVDNRITVEAARSAADKTRDGLNKAVDKTADGLDKAAEKTGEGLSTAKEKTGEGLSTAKEKTGEAVGTTGAVMSDTWITTKVKTKVTKANELDGASVQVSTKNKVVTLSGKVKSETQRAAALRIARDTDGVKDVVDKLVVSTQ